MKEIWEFDRIIDEEYRCVVAYHIVVTLLGVEFDSKSTRIPDGISSTSLTSDSGESQKQRSSLTDFVQKGGLGERSDIVGDLKNTMGS
jgi:hypothetical protein